MIAVKKPRFARYRELRYEHVNRDLHIHTAATDGASTIREILRRAEKMGLGEIAFTEHVRRTSSYDHEFAEAVRATRTETSVRVFVGVETKACDGCGNLDATGNILSDAEIVLGSVHRFPTGNGNYIAANYLGYEEASRNELVLTLAMLENSPIDVVAHPGGMCLRAFGRFPRRYWEEIMRRSLERGVAVEINSSYLRDVNEFLGVCEDLNPYVSVASDVHQLKDLGRCRNMLIARGAIWR